MVAGGEENLLMQLAFMYHVSSLRDDLFLTGYFYFTSAH